jgi:hypothetical protein
MFHGFLVYENEVIKCLTWWKEHGSKFPNFVLLVRQFLGVLGFQIKLKNLQRCHLKITNIDVLVMTFKNRYDNARTNCSSVAFLQ